jgi:S1-C subfamily serine protease
MLSRAASAAAVISAVALVLAVISGYFVNLQEKRAEDLNAEVATLRNTVAQLNSSITQLSGRLQDIEVKVKNLSQSASQLLNQITQLANTNVRLLSEIAALNQSVPTQTIIEMISALNQSLTSKIITLNQSIAALRESIEEKTPGKVYEKVYKSVVVIRTSMGQGSGFVYGENLILTNWHVVKGVSVADVQFYDHTRTTAYVLATDPYSDVAVLKIDRKPADALPLKLGNSSNIWIGETVVAIGNPLGLTGSLSVGVISQVNRLLNLEPIIVPVLQLDITIAPGSSGGPLLNLDGEVIGITNAGTTVGFSFAIPSNIVKRVATDLVSKGYYQHPYFGFSAITLTPETIKTYNILNIDPYQSGLMVIKVEKDTPAEKAGLKAWTRVRTLTGYAYKPGDIILAIDGRRTYTTEDWFAYVSLNVSPNQKVVLTILREGKTIDIEIIPTARPPYQR